MRRTAAIAALVTAFGLHAQAVVDHVHKAVHVIWSPVSRDTFDLTEHNKLRLDFQPADPGVDRNLLRVRVFEGKVEEWQQRAEEASPNPKLCKRYPSFTADITSEPGAMVFNLSFKPYSVYSRYNDELGGGAPLTTKYLTIVVELRSKAGEYEEGPFSLTREQALAYFAEAHGIKVEPPAFPAKESIEAARGTWAALHDATMAAPNPPAPIAEARPACVGLMILTVPQWVYCAPCAATPPEHDTLTASSERTPNAVNYLGEP
jgi:hypothetical protein